MIPGEDEDKHFKGKISISSKRFYFSHSAYKLAIVNEPQARSRIFSKAQDVALFCEKYLTDSKVLYSFLNVCKFAKEYNCGLQMYEKITCENEVPLNDSMIDAIGQSQIDQFSKLFP